MYKGKKLSEGVESNAAFNLDG